MAKAARGTTFSFGGVTYRIFDISDEDAGSEIDITDLGSTAMEYEVDLDDTSIQVQAYGDVAIDRGDTGALVITYNDGSSKSIASAICTRRGKTARIGAAITTSLTFKPTSGT